MRGWRWNLSPVLWRELRVGLSIRCRLVFRDRPIRSPPASLSDDDGIDAPAIEWWSETDETGDDIRRHLPKGSERVSAMVAGSRGLKPPRTESIHRAQHAQT